MKKIERKLKPYGWLIFLLLAGPSLLRATTLSGTVNASYALGTYSITLAGQQGVYYTSNGSAFTQGFTGSLDNTASFSITVVGNDQIQPDGSQWKFTICNYGGGVCFTAQATVTGSSQSVSTLLQGAAYPMPLTSTYMHFLGSPSGSCATTQQAEDDTTGLLYTCLSGSWNQSGGAVTWPLTSPSGATIASNNGDLEFTAGGTNQNITLTPSGTGKSVVNGSNFAPDSNVIFLSPNCNGQANCYAVHDDGQMVTDAQWTNGVASISSASANFVTSDAGKTIFGSNQCVDASQPTAISWVATISSVTDAHDIVPSISAFGTGSTTGCIVWGTPDDTGFSAADSAFKSAASCSTVSMPTGIMLLVEPHFNVQPTACKNNFGGTTGMGYGYWYGPRIHGQGSSTILAIGKNFDIAACTGGSGGSTCFGGIPGAEYDHFQLYGNSATSSSSTQTANMWEVGELSKISNVQLTGYGWNDPNLWGVDFSTFNSWAEDSTFDSVGGTACQIGGQLVASRIICQDGYNAPSTIVAGLGFLRCRECRFFTSNNAHIGDTAVKVSGGIVYCDQCYIWDGGSASAVTGLFADGAGKWIGNQDYYDVTKVAASDTAIFINNAAFIIEERDSRIFGGASHYAVYHQAAGAFYDQGGNTFQGTVTAPVFGSYSVTGTAQTATNITASTGWGGSGAAGNGISAVSGDAHNERFTITAAGTPAASPTVAVVFPTAYLVAPICSASQVGGTGAFGNITTASSETTTGVTLTWSGTPVAASTYVIAVRCQ